MTVPPTRHVGTLTGIPVYLAKEYLKFQLSSNVTVSDEFRRETNEWLASLFGYVSTVPDGEIFKMDPSYLDPFASTRPGTFVYLMSKKTFQDLCRNHPDLMLQP